MTEEDEDFMRSAQVAKPFPIEREKAIAWRESLVVRWNRFYWTSLVGVLLCSVASGIVIRELGFWQALVLFVPLYLNAETCWSANRFVSARKAEIDYLEK